MSKLIEALEGRTLLTLVPNASNVVAITGSLGADTWELQQVNGVLIWRDLISGVTDQTAGVFTGSVFIDLRGGDDYLRLRTKTLSSPVTVAATLAGGAGNDTIFGGEGNDSIYGDDTLNTLTGDDRLDGRGGNDRLDGGLGFDTADYSYRTLAIKVTLDGGSNDGTVAAAGVAGEFDRVLTEAVLGGSGNDALFGDLGANLLDGGSGNDTVVGGPGNDTLTGGVGIDSIFGEDGNDYLFAREGLFDTISDGAGIDSASVDSVTIGDVVTDLPTAAPPPAAASVIPASALASLDFAALDFSGPTIMSVPATPVALPAPGAVLDPAFGTDGKAVHALAGADARITGVAYQEVEVAPDVFETKIVVVGSAAGAGGDSDFYVARFNADGSADLTFGGGLGYVLTDFTAAGAPAGEDDRAAGVVIDAQGRIVVVGTSLKRASLTAPAYGDYAIARYLPGGALDTSFNTDGRDTWDVGGPASDDRAAGLARLSDGEVTYYTVVGTAGLALGSGATATTSDVLLSRWSTGLGIRDTDFGTVRIDFGAAPDTNHDYAAAIAVDDFGNAWVAGSTAATAGGDRDIAVAVVTSWGDVLAKQTADLGGDDAGTGVALTGDRAVVVGSTGANGAIATFNADYGSIITITSGPTAAALPLAEPLGASIVTGGADGAGRAGGVTLGFTGVAVNDDGQAVAIGTVRANGTAGDFVAYQFDPATLVATASGVVDFADLSGGGNIGGGGGGVGTGNGGSADLGAAVVLAPDGAILAVGTTEGDLGLAQFSLPQPFAEVILDYDTVQGLNFTIDETPVTLPEDLVNRLRFGVSPDGTLTVYGTNAPDDITISQQIAGQVEVVVNGEQRLFRSADVKRIVVDARGGPDTVLADVSVVLPLTLLGGSGDDVLGGGSAADDVRGGDGADVLLGNAGDDALDGGLGRDVAIGGLGKDAIGGGGDDDVLIGGTTSYDTDETALSLIRAEWVANRSYANRVASLNGQGPGSGQNVRTTLKAGKTVFDDGATDVLTGGLGEDYFLVTAKGANADRITDQAKGEKT
ncbi:MAG TPA: hypothetical protein VEA69_12470 [Tepidisphaeraceae bacterium]|nr:hypothetical protein [Tepidisphaeraceae bacterium]